MGIDFTAFLDLNQPVKKELIKKKEPAKKPVKEIKQKGVDFSDVLPQVGSETSVIETEVCYNDGKYPEEEKALYDALYMPPWD